MQREKYGFVLWLGRWIDEKWNLKPFQKQKSPDVCLGSQEDKGWQAFEGCSRQWLEKAHIRVKPSQGGVSNTMKVKSNNIESTLQNVFKNFKNCLGFVIWQEDGCFGDLLN